MSKREEKSANEKQLKNRFKQYVSETKTSVSLLSNHWIGQFTTFDLHERFVTCVNQHNNLIVEAVLDKSL